MYLQMERAAAILSSKICQTLLSTILLPVCISRLQKGL